MFLYFYTDIIFLIVCDYRESKLLYPKSHWNKHDSDKLEFFHMNIIMVVISFVMKKFTLDLIKQENNKTGIN